MIIPRERILCQAVIDGENPFQVTVTGKAPHFGVRIYSIEAKDANSAAMEGIDRYVDEFSQPLRIVR